MGEKHIDFSNWNPGQQLDNAHLESCVFCRQNLELSHFLKFQVDQVPHIEAPPFFAVRLANLVRRSRESSGSFWSLVEISARRLIPGFSALILVLVLFGFDFPLKPQQPTDEELWAALFMEPQLTETITLDEVILSLQEGLQETNSEGQY